MNFIFVGMLLGSIVTSNHDTREACEGRAIVLKEKGVIGQCVKVTNSVSLTTWSGNSISCLKPDGISGPCN